MTSTKHPRCLIAATFSLCAIATAIIVLQPEPTDQWVAVATSNQLGNMLWQLASSHSVARRRHARWCVLDTDGWFSTYRKYVQWTHGPPEACPGWNLAFVKYTQLFTRVPDDGCAVHTDKFLRAPFPRILMDGCLQSYKFIDRPLPFALAAESRALAWVAERNVTAAIHVRRGDKLTAFANIVPTIHYYYLATAALERQFGGQRYVVCTDDPDWVLGHPFFKSMHVLSTPDPSFDMAVISACKHAIISIGTFGWWGAFLGNGTVIYPLPQMTDVWKDGFHNDDYFPRHWVPIEYTKS